MKNLNLYALLLAVAPVTASAQLTPTSQMEKLDRGVLAVKSGSNLFVTLRL